MMPRPPPPSTYPFIDPEYKDNSDSDDDGMYDKCTEWWNEYSAIKREIGALSDQVTNYGADLTELHGRLDRREANQTDMVIINAHVKSTNQLMRTFKTHLAKLKKLLQDNDCADVLDLEEDAFM